MLSVGFGCTERERFAGLVGIVGLYVVCLLFISITHKNCHPQKGKKIQCKSTRIPQPIILIKSH